MRTHRYRVGIIGCGRVAWLLDADPLIPNRPVTHLGAYERVRRIEVVAGADIRPDRIDAFSYVVGKEHVYLDYREMLAREQFDIVSVCAYAPDRHRMVMDALKAGVKGIWCEKAFATSLEEAREMTEACRERRVSLIVGHTRRWSPEYQIAKGIIEKGGIGRPLSATCLMSGSLVHTGTHAFDTLRFLLGEVEWVEGRLENLPRNVSRLFPQGSGEDVFQDAGGYALIAFQSGAYAVVQGEGKEYFLFEFDILGTKGRIRIGNWLFEVYGARESGRESGLRELYPVKKGRKRRTHPLVEAVRHLVGCIEGTTENIGGPREGMAALEVALAIRESDRQGGARVHMPLREQGLKVLSR
jgi:predicted dehydrogenase